MKWLSGFFKNLFGGKKEETPMPQNFEVTKIPLFGQSHADVMTLKLAINRYRKKDVLDPSNQYFGPTTREEISRIQKENGLTGTGNIGAETLRILKIGIRSKPEVKSDPKKDSRPPWYVYALQFKGKKETDKEFSKKMIPKWSLFGMNLGTISTSWAAWCGLAMAVALAGVGIDHAKDGALARNWGAYGVKIEWKKEGIPQGAIVHINNKGNCSSSASNHVAQADGDCTPEHLVKPGATINLYGGNQGNTWKVSTYRADRICNVRWPKEYPKRERITKNVNCTSGAAGNESTR